MNYLRRINELVKNNKMTFVDVANVINRDRNTAKYYLSGSTPMRVEDLIKIAEYFKIHPGSLLDEDYKHPINPERDREMNDLKKDNENLKLILESKEDLISALKNQAEILTEQVNHFKKMYEKFSANE